MSRPFGLVAKQPKPGKASEPYQGLSAAQQGQAIRDAEEKRLRRKARRLTERRP